MSTNHSGNVVSGVYCLLTLRLWNRRFESPSGPPRAGSGPTEKILSGPPARADRQEESKETKKQLRKPDDRWPQVPSTRHVTT